MDTTQASTYLHRCDGCGGWTLGWCGTCRRIHNRDATQTILQEAVDRASALEEGRAHRGALEAALSGTGQQHRPTPATPRPHRGAGAHPAAPRTP